MSDVLLAQADNVPGAFYVPGAENLPGWVIGIGGLAYVLILAWNAASNFSAGRKQAQSDTEKSEKVIPPSMMVTGAALADRQAMSSLTESMEDLAEAIRWGLGEKSPAAMAIAAFTAAVSRLAAVYEKRVEMEERDAREAEIRRRVDEELRRHNERA